MKISVIFGTRPEAIKLAPVVFELRRRDNVECHVCSTGQHREMLDQVMQFFGIRPDSSLDLMQSGQTLGEYTARAVRELDLYLADQRPDFVLAQGDTTTTFCAALAAFYQRIPLGHVEAGLRTWDLSSPWPEEANRVLTSRLANLHFAPTESSRENLIREGVPERSISVTGNTVIDALLMALQAVRAKPPLISGLPDVLQPCGEGRASTPRVVLITGHRREHFGAPFESVCQAIADLARRFPDVHFVYPVHLNPNVREPVQRILGNTVAVDRAGAGVAPNLSGRVRSTLTSARDNVHLLEPLPYPSFVAMMDRATLILTDSGGVQEEAPSIGKPVLVMRDTTERPEAVAAGTVRVVGTSRDRIVDGVSELLTDEAVHRKMCECHNPYGDGRAAGRIADACIRFLGEAREGQPNAPAVNEGGVPSGHSLLRPIEPFKAS